VLAFLDRAPLAPGHTLVITREHIETLEDIPTDLLTPFFGLVQRVSRTFAPALGAEGTLVAVNTRISQSVPHVHAHVVPRRKGDRLFTPGAPPMLWIRRQYEEGQAEAIAAKLKGALAALAAST
jgi:histidine triad (HIT) family protein